MSMIGNLMRVSPDVLAELLADPERIMDLLYPEDESAPPNRLDFDKAWHGLQFLLTGDAWGGEPPLNFIVGGTEIGDVDVGYGPARGFTADEVRALAMALTPITAATLRAKYDANDLEANEIYPTGWTHEGVDACDYLLAHFESLKQFVIATAEANAALLVYIN